MIQAAAWIDVSNDGVNWTEIWHNNMWRYTDNQWRAWEYDISDVADNQPAVSVRWGYATHPMVWRMSGWNIDDIEFLGFAPIELIPGDLDADADVDLNDFATFALCFAGAGVTVPPPGCAAEQFGNADLDGDADVDLSDFATFATHFTG